MKKAILFSTLIIFLFLITFGLNLCVSRKSMHLESQSVMTNSSENGCPMNILSHIAKWHQAFEATFNQTGGFLLLTFTFFATLSFLLSRFILAPPLQQAFEHQRKRQPDIGILNPVLNAISNGTLQSKIFS